MLTKVSMNRFFIIFSTLLALLSSCSGKQQGEQTGQPQDSGKFDITGTWMLVNMTDHEGRVMDMIRNRNFLSCTIYESDSTYYDVNLWAVDGKTYLFPCETGQYELNDTLLKRISLVTPIRVINDSTMVVVHKLWIQTWRRSTTITESRKQEFLEAVRNDQNSDGEQLRGFVLSTSERDLKQTIHAYHYLFIALLSVILIIVIYAVELTKRKRRAEVNLAAIKEELNLRPAVITDAIKQVEDDFFQSDYYTALRIRIAEGSNMTDEDWREMERQVNAISSGFTRKLRSLYDFSDVEYQVCLLIKLRIPHKDIAAITHRAPDSVSSIRSRLHKKILGPNGGAKEWDYFILSL